MRDARARLRHMTQVAMAAALFATLAVGAVGCSTGTSDSPRGGTLTDARWVLASYAVDGEQTDVPAGVNSDATFAEQRMAGAGGVNQFTAPCTAKDDGSLEIGDVAATLMAGPPDATAVETAVFAAFNITTAYFADDTSLTLYDKDDNVLLVYNKGADGLAGTNWLVTGYNNGKQAVQSVTGGVELTAAFDDADKVTGFAGVNDYNGPCTLDGKNVTVGPLATTRMAGEPALMEQETLFLAALQSAATYSIRGATLEFRTAEDAIAVTFTSK